MILEAKTDLTSIDRATTHKLIIRLGLRVVSLRESGSCLTLEIALLSELTGRESVRNVLICRSYTGPLPRLQCDQL